MQGGRPAGLGAEFLAVAASSSDGPALVHNGDVLTYAALRELALDVAARLGPGPGVVGVWTTRTPATIAALLGTWLAGGAYCPLDPKFPAQRLDEMVAGCDTVLDPVAPMAASAGPARQPAGPTAGPDDPAPAGPDDPAYVLFTSGSTGAPKPVLTPHRAILTVTRALRDLFEVTPADRVLQFASLNWDTCFEEILPTLTAGATLVLDDDAHTGSFRRFLRMVERERITVLDLPTAVWHELVHHLTEDAATLPARVRLVVTGGEAVSPDRLADWTALDTGRVRLLNTYGCTETTLITHAAELLGPYDKVPIGRPLPHVTEHVTAEGELLVAGPALALGYRGRPEQTAARFVDLGGRRYFRTGDRVGRRPDGQLVHEGRLDGEVKVRGIRVDPAEVEAHLARHPAVAEAAVAGVRVANHTTLAAYVVVRPNADLAGLDASILADLRARVPGHLVPSRLTVVAALARTPSGKVDRAGAHRRHVVMEGTT
ncbi:MAG TPA: amino acid adenylation domain-containing protein [Actinophytocola sp.]|nr:amino acid adenylation domain-containing protein [Actinophytocola sp.]